MTGSLNKHTEGGGGNSREGLVRAVILLLFFLSGACGLVYEVVWMRMLTLVFGATAFATSTILASFFAGLALGAFYFGRVADRGRSSPLALYAILEVGVGLFAFLMPLLFALLSSIYVFMYQQFGLGFYTLSFLRFVLSFLILVLPATLMGGTLPVIIKYVVQRRDRLGWDVGQFYAINTFGAVVGTLSAGFFLILLLGVKEAAYLAGTVNILIAGIAFALNRRLGWRQEVPVKESTGEEDPQEGGEGVLTSKETRLVLWAVGLSGFCALALEVLWTRALVFFLDNSTHAFTTILTAFLLGIAIGAIVIARLVDARKNLLLWLGGVEVLIGIFAILAIPILGHSTPVIQSMTTISPLDSLLQWKWVGLRFVTTLSVMLIPTVLIGMTFPLVIKIYARSVKTVGTALGRVYSINTLGGVFGSVTGGFLLIPLMGVQNSVVLISAINVCIGVVLIVFDPVTAVKVKRGIIGGSVVVFGGLATYGLTGGSMNMVSYTERIEAAEIHFYKEGIGSTVKVFESDFGDRLVSINGFPVAGTPLGLQDAQIPLAHLPLLLSGAQNPRVNLVGFGAGGASWGVMQYDVEEVDCVELVPAVIDAAQFFPDVNHGVVNEPRYNVVLGDGRNYALMTDKTYDVISVDATSPKMAGNGSLYALEFYDLLKGNLNEGGVVVQWFPLHLLSEEEVRMTVKTFMEVFPHTSLWLTPLRGHAIILGTEERLEVDLASFRSKLERSHILRELEELKVFDIYDVLSWFAMGEDVLWDYVKDSGINTDNHPLLEFTPAMAYFVADAFKGLNMGHILEHRESVGPYLNNLGGTEEENAEFLEKVRLRFESTQHSLQGDILLALGRRDEAIVEYNLALLIDPEDKNWMNVVWDDRRPER